MFNIHTHIIDSLPCLYSIGNKETPAYLPKHAALSAGMHPWCVTSNWKDSFEHIAHIASRDDVWAIGECGLDKMRGANIDVQMEVMRAHINLAEQLRKPMVVHCVKAFDQLLMLRKELEQACKHSGYTPQPWVIHGFRGKPEQAKQLVAKGLYLSFGHQYNVETVRCLFNCGHPFYLETDDLHLSVCHIYEQVARHLDVEPSHLESLCDPLQKFFHR